MDGVTAASDLPAQYEAAYQHLLQRVYRALGCTHLDDVSTIRDEVASFIESVTQDRYILPLSDYDAMIRNGDCMLESLDEHLDLIRAQPQDVPTNGSAHPPFSADDLSFIDHYGDLYDHLHERVTIGLVSHASDITALVALRGDVSAFLANLEQHSLRVPGPDYAAMRTNAVQMLAALNDAQADARVPSDSAHIRIVNSFPDAYDVLLARVNRTLLAHLGNGPEIAATRADAISIHTQVQFHRHALPADGYASLSYNITQMIEALDDAAEQCRDPPDAPPISVTHNATNRIGRPPCAVGRV
ncbi:uncharacterized protein SCHCODRAFT_01204596 [Schizophyllum commune H4-8]|nr:uncharacterized protein SCHCODRAFT_01204596 [Schizophyllum commune H4-8]KAI5887562.1 hypothetical protein SCHCODRAFT_01204596 [Schizophyllum commune H4-8]